jgi:crossover junction endodeoxyribonuclease RuvC
MAIYPSSSLELPKLIMGVDPGTQIMGYAIIEVAGRESRHKAKEDIRPHD